MIQVMGKDTSINVRKVLWCLDIIGCHYKHINAVDVSYLKTLNPNQLVPVIIDADLVLWESNTILRYLGRKFPAENLYSDTPTEAALIDQWLDWQATTFNSSWNYAFQAIVRKNSSYSNQAEIGKSLASWNACIELLNHHFCNLEFSTGDLFRISDIALALSLNRWYMATGERGKFEHVDRYYDSCSIKSCFEKRVKNGIP